MVAMCVMMGARKSQAEQPAIVMRKQNERERKERWNINKIWIISNPTRHATRNGESRSKLLESGWCGEEVKSHRMTSWITQISPLCQPVSHSPLSWFCLFYFLAGWSDDDEWREPQVIEEVEVLHHHHRSASFTERKWVIAMIHGRLTYLFFQSTTAQPQWVRSRFHDEPAIFHVVCERASENRSMCLKNEKLICENWIDSFMTLFGAWTSKTLHKYTGSVQSEK